MHFNFILISQKGRNFSLMSASFTVLLSLWMHFGEGKAEPPDFFSSHAKQQQLLIQRVKTFQENQEKVAVSKHMI